MHICPHHLTLQDSHAASTARRLCFSSLCLLAQEGGPPLLAPLNGQVDVTVSWLLDQLPDRQPHLSVAVSVEGVQLQLRPPDVVALLQLARGFTAAATQPQQPVTVLPNSGGSTLVLPSLVKQESLQPRRHLHPHTSTSSFLEDLMLPGCKGLVQEALLESAASVTGQVCHQRLGCVVCKLGWGACGAAVLAQQLACLAHRRTCPFTASVAGGAQ